MPIDIDAPPALVEPASHHHHRKQRSWHWKWRHQISPGDRGWYRVTARCESGNNPWINTGNGYFGAVQWLPSTWRVARGTTAPDLPIHHGRYDQAVTGVRWMHSAGRGQWPVCGS